MTHCLFSSCIWTNRVLLQKLLVIQQRHGLALKSTAVSCSCWWPLSVVTPAEVLLRNRGVNILFELARSDDDVHLLCCGTGLVCRKSDDVRLSLRTSAIVEMNIWLPGCSSKNLYGSNPGDLIKLIEPSTRSSCHTFYSITLKNVCFLF